MTNNKQKFNFAVGDRLKELRENKRYSQATLVAELAEFDFDVEIPVTTYSRYESGTTPVPIYLLYILSEYYHVSIDYIVNGTEPSADEETMRILRLLPLEQQSIVSFLLAQYCDYYFNCNK